MSANKETIAQSDREKKTALGIEFGSTRIKAVLVGEDHTPIASGAHDWENRLTDRHLDLYAGGYLDRHPGLPTQSWQRM